MGFARFPKLTGHHSGHQFIGDGIKYYTTFNASATRSLVQVTVLINIGSIPNTSGDPYFSHVKKNRPL